MSMWADDNDEWCGVGGMSCNFGPEPCRSGVCLHYGRCMGRDTEDAGQDAPVADAQPSFDGDKFMAWLRELAEAVGPALVVVNSPAGGLLRLAATDKLVAFYEKHRVLPPMGSRDGGKGGKQE